MKFPTITAAVVALCAVNSISAHPLEHTARGRFSNVRNNRNNQNNQKNQNNQNNQNDCQPQGQANSAGAAYFITNQPDGNFIVGSEIGQDGKLTFGSVVWAGGLGSHGQSNPIGPDPLFSQGAIKVSGQNVFAVNPGSNTVSMFQIDPRDPAKLTMVGMPIGTGGDFPMSVTISKQSGNVCVLNGGQNSGVNCFKQDKKNGLSLLSGTERALNLNQTTPPSGPPGTASHIIFNEDGSQLLASVKGVPPTPGFIASWDVDSQTGALSQDFTASTPAQGGLLPFSMTVIPGKDAVLATDAGVGFDIFDFKNSKNASSTIVPINGQKATCWSSFSTKTGNFYLTDVGTSTVTEVNVDNNLKGTIVKQYPQSNGSATIDNDVATINNKDFLYVMAPGATSVMVLSLNAPGKATPAQQFNFAKQVEQAGVTVDSNNLQGMAVFVGQ